MEHRGTDCERVDEFNQMVTGPDSKFFLYRELNILAAYEQFLFLTN